MWDTVDMPSDKVFNTKPQLRFGFVNETFIFGLKTSYCAITLYYCPVLAEGANVVIELFVMHKADHSSQLDSK